MAAWTCADCTTVYTVGAPVCPHCGGTKRTPDSVGALQVPALTVACTTGGCPHAGVVRRVVLTQVVPGVLVLPTLVCAACRTHLPLVKEPDMPKITVHGGPSVADTEGSEDVSAGTSSSTSSATPESKSLSSENSSDDNPQPARTTENRSNRRRTAGSSARSTGGGRTAGTSATD